MLNKLRTILLLATPTLGITTDVGKVEKEEAALFSTGYLYGVKIGQYDEKDLYECIEREFELLGFFRKMQEDMKFGIDNQRESSFVNGLSGMTTFIMHLARGKEKDGEFACKEID